MVQEHVLLTVYHVNVENLSFSGTECKILRRCLAKPFPKSLCAPLSYKMSF